MLDINTPKGQITLVNEKEMIERFAKRFNLQVMETPKKLQAKCDGFFGRDNVIVSLFESKCREVTEEQFIHFKTWILTREKLIACRDIAAKLCVPFIGLVYLLPEKIIYWWELSDNEGNWKVNFESRFTKTQSNVNGGQIIRENAYIPIEYAKIIRKEG